MKQYTVYKPSGEIVCSGVCQSIDFEAQNRDGCSIIEAQGNIKTQYVENEQLIDMPEKPGENYKFDYLTKEWIFDPSKASADALTLRKQLLLDSDYTQLPDVPLSDKQAWAAYRQELRDITEQPDYPNVIIWPTPPTEGA